MGSLEREWNTLNVMSSFFIRIPMMLPKKENKKAILSFLFELVPNFSKETVDNKPTIKTARSDFF